MRLALLLVTFAYGLIGYICVPGTRALGSPQVGDTTSSLGVDALPVSATVAPFSMPHDGRGKGTRSKLIYQPVENTGQIDSCSQLGAECMKAIDHSRPCSDLHPSEALSFGRARRPGSCEYGCSNGSDAASPHQPKLACGVK